MNKVVGLAELCEDVLAVMELVYTKPAMRFSGHLEGFDHSKTPTFAWPERLDEVKRKIREAAKNGN